MKHLYIIFIITLLCGIEIDAQTIASGFAGGAGTEKDPYQIANIEQLRYLAQQCNNGVSYEGKYIILTANIIDNDNVIDNNGNLVEHQNQIRKWNPIGVDDKNYFMGNFDGKGFKLSGFFNNEEFGGIFRYVNGCTFKNIKIEDSYIEAFQSCPLNAKNYSNIVFDNCINYATTTYGLSYGGLPKDNITFMNCGNYGNNSISGIALRATSMLNCYNFGKIEAESRRVTGLANNCAIMLNCFNAGKVIDTSNHIGVVGLI